MSISTYHSITLASLYFSNISKSWPAASSNLNRRQYTELLLSYITIRSNTSAAYAEKRSCKVIFSPPRLYDLAIPEFGPDSLQDPLERRGATKRSPPVARLPRIEREKTNLSLVKSVNVSVDSFFAASFEICHYRHPLSIKT